MPKIPAKPKTGLAKKLVASGAKERRSRSEPVWAGPESDADNGGITQSLLSRFLVCPERFRLTVIEGLRPSEGWNKSLGYGNLWHACEEALAGEQDWRAALKKYAQEQLREFRAPNDQTAIDHWYNVCLVQFPEYVAYWSKHPDVENRTPLLQEQVFKVPYRLPSGRTVYLRGKFDSVDLVKNGKLASVWLHENKTKGDINEEMIKRQLSSGFDLQTMLYLIALESSKRTRVEERGRVLRINGYNFGNGQTNLFKIEDDGPIAGVRYNVIRRPLSGGKGSIKRGDGTEGSTCPGCNGEGKRTLYAGTKREVYEPKCSKCEGTRKVGAKPPEPKADFYERLRRDYIAAEPEYWFMRWNVEIKPEHIARFRRECLDPILESLCNWYDYVVGGDAFRATKMDRPYGYYPNYRLPFGIFNPLAEGGASDLDEYLLNGNEVGLTRTDNLFPELS